MGCTTSGSPAKRVALKPGGSVIAFAASLGGSGRSGGAASTEPGARDVNAITQGVRGMAAPLRAIGSGRVIGPGRAARGARLRDPSPARVAAAPTCLLAPAPLLSHRDPTPA